MLSIIFRKEEKKSIRKENNSPKIELKRRVGGNAKGGKEEKTQKLGFLACVKR